MTSFARCLVLVAALLAALFLLGCAEAQYGAASPKSAAGEMLMPPKEAVDAPAPPPPPGAYREMTGGSLDNAVAANVPGVVATSTTPAPSTPREPPPDRAAILIYTGTFGLAVVVVADAVRQTEAMAREVGGFISRRDDRSITIRVPVARFDEVVHRIEKMGDVLHRNVTALDVTEEFTDLETRLKSAKAVRDRLRELLAKATAVQDSLAIERELSRIETDIERMETRYKYLRDQAMYSTITVEFEAKRTDADHPPFRLPVDWLNHIGLGRLLEL